MLNFFMFFFSLFVEELVAKLKNISDRKLILPDQLKKKWHSLLYKCITQEKTFRGTIARKYTDI